MSHLCTKTNFLFSTYPKSPKMKAVIERFNRTLPEEFIDHYEDLLFEDTNTFNYLLMDYLLFYNTKRLPFLP